MLTGTRRLSAAFSVIAVALLLACTGSSEPSAPAAAVAPPEGQPRVGYLLARGPELFDVELDGKSRKVLGFEDGSAIFEPVLSPDGKRIAFIRQEPVKNVATAAGIDFGSDLYVVNRDGSGLKELAHHAALAEYLRGPAWLDGNRVLFSVRGRTADGSADYRVEVIDVASGARTRMIRDAVDPSVGPDRRGIVFISVQTADSRESVVLADADGSNRRDLIPASAQLTLLGSAHISPDGTRVVFAAGDLAGALAGPGRGSARASVHPSFQDVWVVDIDGSGLRRLAEVAERGLSLSWSPDGRWVYALGAERFRRIDSQTGEITVLGEGALQGGGVFFYVEP